MSNMPRGGQGPSAESLFKAFKERFPSAVILTELIIVNDVYAVVKATVYIEQNPVVTRHGQCQFDPSNKSTQLHVSTAETRALKRAISFMLMGYKMSSGSPSGSPSGSSSNHQSPFSEPHEIQWGRAKKYIAGAGLDLAKFLSTIGLARLEDFVGTREDLLALVEEVKAANEGKLPL